MSKTSEAGKAIGNKITSLLGGKPIWVWWIVYVSLTGMLFGLLVLAYNLLTSYWWVAVLILLATGLIWGSVGYSREKAKVEKESVKKEKKKVVEEDEDKE